MTSSIMRQNAAAVAAPAKTIRDYVTLMHGEIAKALPSVITPERFTRMALSALSANPKLEACTPTSFLAAMMTAAQLGLEPNTPLGQAYLIPYGRDCQFQLGYKGLLDLAYRSGEIKSIQAHEVREHDEFDYAYGLEPKLRHIPAVRDRGNVTHYYAVFETKAGGVGFAVMSAEDILNHAKKYSKSYGSGPWQTAFDEMAKKTVLKAVLKYAPMKSDFIRAAAQDEVVRNELSDDMTTAPVVDVTDEPDAGQAEKVETNA